MGNGEKKRRERRREIERKGGRQRDRERERQTGIFFQKLLMKPMMNLNFIGFFHGLQTQKFFILRR